MDIDLSDIDPLKWTEVRRRAAAVREYLALKHPTGADRERFAAMLDLGAHQFANLVKAWAAHQDATVLAPGMRRCAPSRSRRDGVDPRAREIARQTIADMGDDAPLAELVDAVAKRCANVRATPPSRGTIWLLTMERRGARLKQDPDGIVVARAHLRLPVDTGSAIVFPEVVIAAEIPTGRIVDASLATGEIEFDACRLASSIVHQPQWAELPVIASEPEGQGLLSVGAATGEIRLVAPAEAKRVLAKSIGKRIGRLELAYRAPSVRPLTVMQAGRDRAPNVEDAELALLFARERHNQDKSVPA